MHVPIRDLFILVVLCDYVHGGRVNMVARCGGGMVVVIWWLVVMVAVVYTVYH